MIIIISDESDITTNKVCEYLIGNKKEFKRINKEVVSNISFVSDSTDKGVIIKINDYIITTKDTLWIRRARLNFFPFEIGQTDQEAVNYLLKEENSLNKSIELVLKDTYRVYGTYLLEVENHKLLNLMKASQAGLKIPKSIITTKKDDLTAFKKENIEIITKDIRYPVNIYYKDVIKTSSGTTIITNKDIELLDDTFFPIFAQKLIPKYIEIRAFIFDNKIFSMGIFSQENEITKIDYRNTNENNFNRLVPITLPTELEVKLKLFMELAKLDSGSIDLIMDKEGSYHFLEVNPQGQIDWVSKNCNYHLEKIISETL